MKNPFNKITQNNKIYVSEYFFVIKDKYPVSVNHLLIISKREITDYFKLNEKEKKELYLVIDTCKIIIEETNKPDGYNIGMNCGKYAGQTVMRFHCHVIPRYKGDMLKPDGGIRHCVAGKGYYK